MRTNKNVPVLRNTLRKVSQTNNHGPMYVIPTGYVHIDVILITINRHP